MAYTPFRLFYRVIVPVILMGLALIESIAAAAFLLNQPSDFAVFGGVLIVPAVVLACASAAKRLWFPQSNS